MEISEEELEKLVEKKVEERLKEREKETEDSSNKEKDEINRRQFLKMAGLGAGALGISSAASALTFSPLGSGGGGSKQKLSEVLSEGNDVNNQDIVDGGTTIWDTSQQHIPATSINQNNINHSNLTGKNTDDHHTRYTNSEARTAVDGANITVNNANNLNGNPPSNYETPASTQSEGITVGWVESFLPSGSDDGFGGSLPVSKEIHLLVEEVEVLDDTTVTFEFADRTNIELQGPDSQTINESFLTAISSEGSSADVRFRVLKLPSHNHGI
jgi:hypothetical protein